jgi:signal recognition particle subunit SEC65
MQQEIRMVPSAEIRACFRWKSGKDERGTPPGEKVNNLSFLITDGMKRNKQWVLWPSYFDLRLKRKHGRRVPKKAAVESPTVQMIADALKSLGIEHETDENASYPSQRHRKEGRVFVSRAVGKAELIRAVSRKLREK